MGRILSLGVFYSTQKEAFYPAFMELDICKSSYKEISTFRDNRNSLAGDRLTAFLQRCVYKGLYVLPMEKLCALDGIYIYIYIYLWFPCRMVLADHVAVMSCIGGFVIA